MLYKKTYTCVGLHRKCDEQGTFLHHESEAGTAFFAKKAGWYLISEKDDTWVCPKCFKFWGGFEGVDFDVILKEFNKK